METIVNTVTLGALDLVEGLNNHSTKYYLVKMDTSQWLVETTNHYIKSITLETRITNNSFRYAGYKFTKGGNIKQLLI